MAQKLLVISIDSLVKLLTHYSEGLMPLGAEAREFGFSPLLPRFLQLVVESKDWDRPWPPLHIRFEGGKMMRWDEKGTDPRWTESNEAPKRQ